MHSISSRNNTTAILSKDYTFFSSTMSNVSFLRIRCSSRRYSITRMFDKERFIVLIQVMPGIRNSHTVIGRVLSADAYYSYDFKKKRFSRDSELLLFALVE